MNTIPLASTAKGIVARLRAAGHSAYFAGGSVRDLLLGKTPHDIDIATSARPEQVRELFSRTHAVGAHFGVILVVEDGCAFEVATFRTETGYSDGRRPDQVTFATAREDAQRRDFTVNGMFYDPTEERTIDYVGGEADLAARCIRAIGVPSQRFGEDRLRLLRCVRFATTLDFEIDPRTWDALKAAAAEIRQVSLERVREELCKLFLDRHRGRGLDLLQQSGLLAHVLPEVEALKGCEQPAEFHPEGDVYVHTRIMLDLLGPEVSTPLVWSVLLHDIGKPPTARTDENGRIRFNGHDRLGAEMAGVLLRRLRFSNIDIARIVEAVRQHMVFKDVQKMRVAKLKRFMARPHFEEELELHRVDCLSSHGLVDNLEFLKAKAREFAAEPIIPPRLLTGHDLLETGWPAGPQLGRVLEQVQNAQLEGAISTREEALLLAQRLREDQGNRDSPPNQPS